MQPLVTLSGVSFELPDGRLLLNNIDISLDSRLTALIGPNGIGKTTLAKLISGELNPSQGMIRRNVPVSFFAQREKPSDIVVYEYLSPQYTWSLLGERLLEGIDRELSCQKLSGGQWMRVRLAKAMEENFLILDEPSNDLDREGKTALLDFLRDYTFGALIISHDRECLNLCDNILELSNQGLSKYGGDWKTYEEMKDAEREHLQNNLDRAKKEREAAHLERITQLEKQEKRNRRGEALKAKGGIPRIILGGMKRRAQATTGKINLSTLDKAQDKVREAHEAFNALKVDPVMYAELSGESIPNQKLVAEAHGFNIKFNSWIYPQDLHFSWRGNIRLALKGGNGSGKSTLIKAILGMDFQTRGELKTGELNTLYLDQQCSILNDSTSVFENIRSKSPLSDKELRNGLAKFLFFGETVFQQVGTLSGGERLRAALAMGLLSEEKPQLLILDEPTNNLDLQNIEFLEGFVSQFKGALIIVSHDDIFLQECDIKEVLQLSD